MFCSERRKKPDCVFKSSQFKLQGPKSSTSHFHTADQTVCTPRVCACVCVLNLSLTPQCRFTVCL